VSGLAVRADLAQAVRDAQDAFAQFGVDSFPWTVQFALTGVAIKAVNKLRENIPTIWHQPGCMTLSALRYSVDKNLLGKVVSVGAAKDDVFVADLQSTWLKFAFGSCAAHAVPLDPHADYEPIASLSWEREMMAAALTMGDRLAVELSDRLEHLARKGKR
jgi:hypothetical protein